MSCCPRWKCTRMAQLWNWLIFVEQSSEQVLTRTEWLHSSYLSGSPGLWSDLWCPGSTAAAPLLSEGHTSEQSGWVERSKVTFQNRGKNIACIHSVLSPFLHTILGKYLPFEFHPYKNFKKVEKRSQICGSPCVLCLGIKFQNHSISMYYAFVLPT